MPSGGVLVDLLTRKIKIRCLGIVSNSWIRIRIKLKSRIRIRFFIKLKSRILYQKGLDPHHCLAVPTVRYKNLGFKFNTLRDSRKRFLASGFWQELTLWTPESQKLVSNSVEMYLQGYQTLWKFIPRGIRSAEIYSEGSDIFQKLFTRDLIPRRILFWEVS